jgi:hypothetical protein
VEQSGTGPRPLSWKNLTVDQLVEAFHIAHQPSIRAAAQCIRATILNENGCEATVRSFHDNLPLSKMRSDLETTFAACYRLKEFDLQISRPVAQVLVAAGAINESQLFPHRPCEWHFEYNDYNYLYTCGIIQHFLKALFSIFLAIFMSLRQLVQLIGLWTDMCRSSNSPIREFRQCLGHLFIAGVLLCSHTVNGFVLLQLFFNFLR